MKLAIMQPYLFPYLGYFQLIHAVDTFVFFDDVNYINRGWVNRNRLLANGRACYFTIPLEGASQSRLISEIRVSEPASWKRKMLALFQQSYARAPHVKVGMGLVEEVLDLKTDSIGDLARQSVLAVMRVCGLTAKTVPSSTVYGNAALRGEARIVDICLRERATHYVNAPGGRALYEPAHFAQHGMRLGFIEPVLSPYPQVRSPAFVPGLSVIDALMNCGAETTRALVSTYDVVAAT